MSRPTVTILSVTPFYGGGEQYLYKLIKGIKDEFNIELICCSSLLRDKLENEGITISLIESPGLLKRYFEVYMLLKANASNDILFCNGQGAAWLVPLVYRVFKKVVYVQHTSLSLNTSVRKIKLLKYCLSKVDTIVCVSRTLETEIKALFRKANTTVIYNWINSTPTNSQYHIEVKQDLQLIYVGRLVKEKGVLELLKAVQEIHGVYLTILGDGPLFDELKAKFNHEKLTFVGWTNDVEYYYQKAHLNIVPSHSEGFSFAPIEAAAFNVPSLISDIPVHREISMEGEYSWLFAVGDKNDLIKNLNWLKNNRTVLKSMSEKCSVYYKEKFAEKRALEAYIDEFRRM